MLLFFLYYIFGLYFALSIWVLFISLMHSVNGAQYLDITPFFLSSAVFKTLSASASVIVIVPLTSIYVSL